MQADLSSYQQFKRQFTDRYESIWSHLFNQCHEQLDIKNKNTAVVKLESIISSTFALSQNKGFQSMTMRDLSEHSGISMGGLYTYFSNKQVLASTIHSYLEALCSEWYETLPIKQDQHADHLLAQVRLHLYLSELLKNWFYFVYMECRHLGTQLKKSVMESELKTEQMLLQTLTKGRDNHEFKSSVEANFIAAMIKAMLQDWYLKPWKYHGKKITIESYAQHLQNLLTQLVFI
ncbi:TetR/AcrR family transcriptional regulator [Marinicella sp. W31]|uniref:TetR/AcrR family transcriptional regulator n=1 Tax=Marinicella sp. W31 TaxID=3023713 RepID=UPI0037577A06